MVNALLERFNKGLKEQARILNDIAVANDRLDNQMKKMDRGGDRVNNKRQMQRKRSNVYGSGGFKGGGI